MDIFTASKLADLFLDAGNFVLVLLLCGIVLLRCAWRRSGIVLVALSTALLLAITVTPLDEWTASVLRNRFPPPRALTHVHGILMIGGGGADELVFAAGLMRRYPDARPVFSGGVGFLENEDQPEADSARSSFAAMGFDTGRMAFERRSRTTWENLLYSKRLVQPQPDETWLLVTSALHMPRTMGVAQRLGWEMTPCPYDFDRRAPNKFSLSGNLVLFNETVHEWIGLLAYWLAGKTSALLPSPTTPQSR